jgi:hypothetical protein
MSFTAKAKFQQLPPPVMCRGAGLHRHDAPRQHVEKLQERSAMDRPGNDDETRRVDRVNPEDPLGHIKPHAGDRRGIDDRLAHGRPPFQMALQTTTILARLMPFGAPSTPSAQGRTDASAARFVNGRSWLIVLVTAFGPSPIVGAAAYSSLGDIGGRDAAAGSNRRSIVAASRREALGRYSRRRRLLPLLSMNQRQPDARRACHLADTLPPSLLSSDGWRFA